MSKMLKDLMNKKLYVKCSDVTESDYINMNIYNRTVEDENRVIYYNPLFSSFIITDESNLLGYTKLNIQ